MDNKKENTALNFAPLILNEIVRKRKEIIAKQNKRKASMNSSSIHTRKSSDGSLSRAFSIREIGENNNNTLQFDKNTFFKKNTFLI